MKAYLDIIRTVLDEGQEKADRTGVGTISCFGLQFRHDMQTGFPLVTTKKIAFKTMRVELEGFLKGITDKEWYRERGCHIWDEWANPRVAAYGHDDFARAAMFAQRDLGPVYGFQWRHFGANYEGPLASYNQKGVDQLEDLVETLKRDPNSRRMIVSAWNPVQMDQMALAPCHLLFQANVIGNRLDVGWYQRSVDTMLGLPFNIAQYGMILHLLAQASGLQEGVLVGNLGDVHIYNNHLEWAREQLTRVPFPLPTVVTEPISSIFEWDHTKTKIENYQYHPAIKLPVAI